MVTKRRLLAAEGGPVETAQTPGSYIRFIAAGGPGIDLGRPDGRGYQEEGQI